MSLLVLHHALSCGKKQFFQDKMDDIFETWIDLLEKKA
jgi:hypothetical protein